METPINTINITERENKLFPDKKIMPLVCGNTNYYIKFAFDSDWAKCNKKVANFIVNAKSIPVEFEGDTVQVPALPNALFCDLTISTASTENEQLTSDVERIPLIPTPMAEEMSELHPADNYLARLLGAVNKIERGEISVEKSNFASTAAEATHATDADNAIHATSASSADNATEAVHAQSAESAKTAEHSDTADLATQAEQAQDATHATSADSAAEASHAASADSAKEATHAENADLAKQAKNAEFADNCTKASIAEDSTYSQFSVTAENAGEATHAATADEAEHAKKADIATTAESVESAAEATHATSADEANHAISADEADHAKQADSASEATHAENADSAKTAKTAEFADNCTKASIAEDSTYSQFSVTAENAGEATHAATADEAEHAKKADIATTAESVDSAAEATHAASADEATHAASADEAAHSKKCDLATRAISTEECMYSEYSGRADSADAAYRVGMPFRVYAGTQLVFSYDGSEPVDCFFDESSIISRAMSSTSISLASIEPQFSVGVRGENLIINPNFKINQRQQRVYNCTMTRVKDDQTFPVIYTVDRWKGGRGIVVEVQDDGVKLTNTGDNVDSAQNVFPSVFQQIFEEPFENFAGQNMALSCSVDGKYFKTSSELPKKVSGKKNFMVLDLGKHSGEDTDKLIFAIDENGYLSVSFKLSKGSTFVANYVKLEFGTSATTFVAPFFQNEIKKCRRYYLRTRYDYVNVCARSGNELFSPVIYFPEEMYVAPNVVKLFSEGKSETLPLPESKPAQSHLFNRDKCVYSCAVPEFVNKSCFEIRSQLDEKGQGTFDTNCHYYGGIIADSELYSDDELARLKKFESILDESECS